MHLRHQLRCCPGLVGHGHGHHNRYRNSLHRLSLLCLATDDKCHFLVWFGVKINLMKRCVLLFILSLLLAACQAKTLMVTPTPIFVTATLPPPPRSPTPTAQTETPLAQVIRGQTTIRLNVRPEAGTMSEPLGTLENAIEVEILGQDVEGNWYQITYPAAPDGKAWVNAAYIRLLQQVDVPVIGGEDNGLRRGVVTETLNVRSRPESGSTSLGILPPQAKVVLTGRSTDGAWLQIEYPAGSGEKGWVAAAYVQTNEVDKLPLLSDQGIPVATVTPTVQVIPTFTLLPAPEDGDSAQTPIAQVTFSPDGARRFRFTGQVSAPEGDAEDWVAFTPYAVLGQQVTMHFSLECTGRGDLKVQLLKDNRPVDALQNLACNQPEQRLPLVGGQTYRLHFQIASQHTDLQSIGYIITISNGP